jgi:hypothetical protein
MDDINRSRYSIKEIGKADPLRVRINRPYHDSHATITFYTTIYNNDGKEFSQETMDSRITLVSTGIYEGYDKIERVRTYSRHSFINYSNDDPPVLNLLMYKHGDKEFFIYHGGMSNKPCTIPLNDNAPVNEVDEYIKTTQEFKDAVVEYDELMKVLNLI